MKSWRRTLAIGFIIAITSQLYWNVFVNNLTDSTTGIKIQADEGVLPEGVKLVVTQITSGADYDSRKSDSHDDDLYGDVDHCFFIPNCDILSAGNAIRDAGTACDARSVLLYCVRHDVQAADPE